MSCGLLPISEEALSVSIYYTSHIIRHQLFTHSLSPLSLTHYSQVGKVSYYDGRRSLTGQKERKEFIKVLGKNKVSISHRDLSRTIPYFTLYVFLWQVLMLRNHGLVALGSCVEECFYIMYNLIQACKIQASSFIYTPHPAYYTAEDDIMPQFQVAAVSAGLGNLRQVAEGEKGQEESAGGASVWTTRGQMAFEALMRMLDNQVLLHTIGLSCQ